MAAEDWCSTTGLCSLARDTDRVLDTSAQVSGMPRFVEMLKLDSSHDSVLCCTVRCNAVQYRAVHYSVLQATAHHDGPLHRLDRAASSEQGG
jgi:hypothetical protein